MDQEEIANRLLDEIGQGQRDKAQAAMDAYWENSVPLDRPAASPMNSLTRPGDTSRLSKPKPVKSDCFCNDDGIEYSRTQYVKVYGWRVSFELPDNYYFCDCEIGRNKAADWHRDICPNCEHGFTFEPVYDNKYQTRRQVGFCPDCLAGQTLQTKMDEVVADEVARKQSEWLRESGLAPLQRKQTFDNYICKSEGPGEKAVALLKIGAKEQKSLLLIGNTGVGKSHLAAAYLNFSISLGNRGLFISLTELMAALRKTINHKPDYGESLSWDGLLEKYITAPLLVLDDIGQEKPSEKVNEVLFTLLNCRINWERPTVVTTNFGKDMLIEFGYSPAIVSRLGSFEIVRLSGEDYRVKNRGKLKVVDPWAE